MAANLARIRETIGAAPVTLIAVTKNVDSGSITEAFQSGVTEFGENRVSDALEKQEQVPPSVAQHIRWHFIGHLQTNKVKKVVGNFSLIHSVDSLHLAQEVSRQAQKRSLEQPILLQVKVLEDPGKSGFSPEQLRRDFAQLKDLPNLKLEGLMTIAPLTSDPIVWRQSFNGLRLLRDELEATHGITLRELSMGMTQDWQDAISCGSTMVRLGRAIFGH